MPFGAVTLKPGIDVESTPTLSRASYSSSNLGRFRAGLFEKLGGWVRYFQFALAGIPRALQAWQDLNGLDWLAIGTTTTLDVINEDALSVITPQTKTTDFAPKFTTNTTPGTADQVIVDDSNIANVTTNDSVEFNTPVSVGGIILSGSYPIDASLGTTTYRIIAATDATAIVTNGGAVPSFTTQATNSALVNVTLEDHGLSAGGSFVAPISTSVGGVTILGTYTVVSVTSVDVFVISAATTATSVATVAMNSGDAQIVYYIGLGASGGTGTTYSFGTYSSGPYSGTGAAPTAQTGTAITATDWTLDNWGSTLLSCPANGGVYQWTPGTGFQNAALVPGAPIHNGGIFIATPYQILIAWGTAIQKDIGVAQDPLAWAGSDLLDYTYWGIGTTNPSTGIASQAYQNRIPTGSAIKAGMATPNQVLLWTDLDLWSLNYLGPPLIWGQTKIGANCGTVGRHAVGQMRGITVWWGANNFYGMSGGAPQIIPCSVWDAVFQNLDTDNIHKCWVEPVEGFSEFWFHFPSLSGGTGECDLVAKYNIAENTWDGPNTISRSAGVGQSVLGNPIMATPQGVIYQHERGQDADGQPLVPSFTTGAFYLAEGEDFVVATRFLPDFKYTVSSGTTPSAIIQIIFYVYDYPGDTPRAYGPYSMTTSTQKLDIRLRGRQIAFSMTSTDIGSWWRIGSCKFLYATSGRR